MDFAVWTLRLFRVERVKTGVVDGRVESVDAGVSLLIGLSGNLILPRPIDGLMSRLPSPLGGVFLSGRIHWLKGKTSMLFAVAKTTLYPGVSIRGSCFESGGQHLKWLLAKFTFVCAQFKVLLSPPPPPFFLPPSLSLLFLRL